MATPEILINKMVDMFGDLLASPDHHPRQFAYQAKMAQWELNNIVSKESEDDRGNGVRTQDGTEQASSSSN